MIMGQKFCESCGSKLKPGTKFCSSCGAAVGLSQEKAEPSMSLEPSKETEKRAQPDKKRASWGKWAVIAVLLLAILGGGGYFAYGHFVEPAASEDEEETQDFVVEDFYGYWYAADEEEGIYIDDETFTHEVLEGEVTYYEIRDSELEDASLHLEILPLENEEAQERLFTLEEETLSSEEGLEYEAISEEDYLALGGSDLEELSENPVLADTNEEVEHTEDEEDDDGESGEEFSLTAPDDFDESSSGGNSEEAAEEETTEDVSGDLTFGDIAGFYIDNTEYGQFVYYINETYVASYLFNPASGNHRWTVIELSGYSLDENQFSFEGTSLNDVTWQESSPYLEAYAEDFSFESTNPIGMATSGYATEFSFTKLSIEELSSEIGARYGDPTQVFDELYDYLNSVR